SSVLGKVGNSSAQVTAAFQAAAGDGQKVGGTFGGWFARPGGFLGGGPARVLMMRFTILTKPRNPSALYSRGCGPTPAAHESATSQGDLPMRHRTRQAS